VNTFIDHLQVLTTNKYNTIADFNTSILQIKPSQNTFSNLYLVTALKNDYSSAAFSLDISGNES
jgi:hypothetical protein